jgi:hypothetical protein
MKFSAAKLTRKWPCGRTNGRMVTVAMLLLAGIAPGPAQARKSTPFIWDGLFGDSRPRPRKAPRAAVPPASTVASVPLPKPRPAEAPAKSPEKAVAEKSPEISPSNAAPVSAPTAPAVNKPAEQASAPATPAPAAGPPPPSACRVALTDAIAIAPSIPDIHGPGGCGGEDLVRLEAIVLPDQRKVALKPAATLRCAIASEIADWVRTDVAPLTSGLGSAISTLENYDSFDCRGRNGVPGALLSEHGRANALDVHAFGLADGRSIVLTDRGVARGMREDVLHSMCKRFTTVLGPGSDGYHEDHIHLDLMQRHNNYTICQWYVWDPMPATAPLMPEPRPDDAPPREVAAESDAAKAASPPADPAKTDAAKSDAAKSDGVKVDHAKPDADKPASRSTSDSAKKRATKKRR